MRLLFFERISVWTRSKAQVQVICWHRYYVLSFIRLQLHPMPFLLHYFLHLVFPYVLARRFWSSQPIKSYLILLATMAVDLDHLLANPVYDPHRCSLGFHPLHTWPAILVYAVLCFFSGYWRVLGVGLLLHMLTDGLDCYWMNYLS